MATKFSLKMFVSLLIVVIFASPVIVRAYGGGIPPIIGVGPRFDLVKERASEITDKLRGVRNRLFFVLNLEKQGILALFR